MISMVVLWFGGGRGWSRAGSQRSNAQSPGTEVTIGPVMKGRTMVDGGEVKEGSSVVVVAGVRPGRVF